MRIREVTLDGESHKIAPMTYDEAEAFINEGKEMLARNPKPTDEDWAKRTLNSVLSALNRAAGTEVWNLTGDDGKKKLTKELDMGMINHLHREYLIMSGILLPGAKAGEGPATSTSR